MHLLALMMIFWARLSFTSKSIKYLDVSEYTAKYDTLAVPLLSTILLLWQYYPIM